MKKKIDIKKKIEFASMIGEICSISLENHLNFKDANSIDGCLTLLGSYKATSASQVEEDFHYDLPVDITLTEGVDFLEGSIEITDFYYDIVEDHSLLCHVEIMIEAPEVLEEDRECDGDSVEQKEIEIPHIDSVEPQEYADEERPMNVEKESSSSLFQVDETQETYGTFVVYVIQQNETINSIIEKYNTSIEELEKYNDIKDLSIGNKLIIPIIHAEDTK